MRRFIPLLLLCTLLVSCGDPDMHPDSASDVILRAVWKRLQAR